MRLFAAVMIASAVNAAPAGEIVAHRGASYDAPENTLASVRLGWEQGADAVEIDVWRTRDGRVVCFHDKDTKRIGGRDRRVDEQIYAELRQLDAGGWKGERYRGEPVPPLSDVLPTVPPGKRLFVEVKCGPEVVPDLVRLFAEAGTRPAAAAVISFDADVVAAAKRVMPDRPAYWISSLKPDETTGGFRPGRDELIATAKRVGADGLDLQAKPVIDAEYVRAVKAAGLGFYVWTVNDEAEARRLAAAGVDGITTDRPGYLRERLAAPE